MSSKAYTTANVASITGFTIRQLDYWAQNGIVVPSIEQAHGQGTRKRYAVDDLVPLLCIRRLKQAGWSTQKIRKALTILRDVLADTDPLRKAVVVDGKGTILAIYKTKAGERVVLDTLSIGGQQVLEIILETVMEETRHKVMAYSEKTLHLEESVG
jgi:DNA-binding transcriptional MerR regulator